MSGGFAVKALLIVLVLLAVGLLIKYIIERKPGFFAVDERQIGGVVFDNALMCIMFLIIAGFVIFVAVDRIVFG